MRTLKARLTWGLMLSLIGLLILQWGVVTYAISRLTESQLVDRLQREGESVLAGASFDVAGSLQLNEQHLGSIYQRPFSGHYFIVLSGAQKRFSRSLWDADLNIAALKSGQRIINHVAGPENQPLLVVVGGYKKQHQLLTIAVAEDLSTLQDEMVRFQLFYAAASLAGLIMLLLLQRYIVLKSLQPLQLVKENMARMANGEADHIETRGPEEIQPLIDELNKLLAGMERRSRRSRDGLGNLAHALKTQLTLLNQTAERSQIQALPEIKHLIYSVTDTMSHIIERELKRARMVGEVYRGRKVDLNKEIAQLVHTLRLLYQDKTVNITWEVAADCEFSGDQEDLLELLGNLLDNACKWCQTRVCLSVTGSNQLAFVVEDDGPGCQVSALEVLTRRGFRADETKPGSGLGLAIANDIVESYGGVLIFGRSTVLGGLRVEARLNQARPVA